MASPRGTVNGEERRDGLLHEIFHVLDQKQRGFVSKVELSHILDAMQADANDRLPIPEGLSPRKILRDCRVNLQDLSGFLEELSVADLEDVKWFAESVVKVETELKDAWMAALRKWRDDLLLLQSRDLHRYLLNSQPKAVSRWLQLREDTAPDSPTSPGRPGLGFSQHEVETLFAANTAEEITSYHQRMEPFLKAVEVRRQLEFFVSVDQTLVFLLELQDFATSRDLACLLIHEDTLGLACRCTKTGAISSPATPSIQVISEASKVIMTLLSHNLHSCEHPKVVSMLSSFLEMAYDPEAEVPMLPPLPRVASRDRASIGGRASIAIGPQKPETISTWVETLVTMEADLDRGDLVDKLIKYDEQRLVGNQELVQESLFSHGRTIPVLLGRLNLASHFTTHERRTPLRTHLLKFLLNILSSSGDRGRRLFRSAKGMQVLATVLRGDAWGEPREEGPVEDTLDEELAKTLPESEWQGIYRIEDLRFYPGDFVDDKFYGPKDRILAAAFLEYLGSEELWGDDYLMEEFLAAKGRLLQVLCRVTSCQNLLRYAELHYLTSQTKMKVDRCENLLALIAPHFEPEAARDIMKQAPRKPRRKEPPRLQVQKFGSGNSASKETKDGRSAGEQTPPAPPALSKDVLKEVFSEMQDLPLPVAHASLNASLDLTEMRQLLDSAKEDMSSQMRSLQDAAREVHHNVLKEVSSMQLCVSTTLQSLAQQNAAHVESLARCYGPGVPPASAPVVTPPVPALAPVPVPNFRTHHVSLQEELDTWKRSFFMDLEAFRGAANANASSPSEKALVTEEPVRSRPDVTLRSKISEARLSERSTPSSAASWPASPDITEATRRWKDALNQSSNASPT